MEQKKTILKFYTETTGPENDPQVYARYVKVLGADQKYYPILIGDNEKEFIIPKELIINQIMSTGFILHFGSNAYLEEDDLKELLSKLFDGLYNGFWMAGRLYLDFDFQVYEEK